MRDIKKFADDVAKQTVYTAKSILEKVGVFDDLTYGVKVSGITISISIAIGEFIYCVPEYLYSDDDYKDVEERIMSFTRSYGRFLASDYMERIGMEYDIQQNKCFDDTRKELCQ